MKSAWRSVGKRMVDFMLRKDYDTLSEILEEFRQEEKGIRARIEENNRFIREARVHLNAFRSRSRKVSGIFHPGAPRISTGKKSTASGRKYL